MAIYLDIETVPRDDAADFLDTIVAPSTYKDPEKIAAYVAEAQRKALDKAACTVDLCRVALIGWGDDQDLSAMRILDSQEGHQLLDFWQELTDLHEHHALVTFGGWTFDWPVLIRRSQVCRVPVPSWARLDKYRSPLWKADLAECLTFGGAIGYKRSLRSYCKLFGVPVSDGPSGADMPALIAAGQWDAVEAKNREDLTLLRQLAEVVL